MIRGTLNHIDRIVAIFVALRLRTELRRNPEIFPQKLLDEALVAPAFERADDRARHLPLPGDERE